MKTFSIYDFKSYKAYLKAWILHRPSRGRGEKRRMAEAMGCYSAYVSQVLEHKAHFSLEQAAALSAYIGHTSIESRYFLLLVQHDRAGTKILRDHFQNQLQEILEKHISMRHKLENKKGLSEEDQSIYYSSWHYAAIHMLVMIPGFRTKEAIFKRLKISSRKTAEILEFLVNKGLIKQNGNEYEYGPINLFLPQASPFSAKMHTNWRVRAIQSLDQEEPHDLHYSSVSTIREADLAQVRIIFMKAIEAANEIIKNSTPEDTLFCYNLDIFRP